MREAPDIVKRLREEEKKGSFNNLYLSSQKKPNKVGVVLSNKKDSSKNKISSDKNQIKKRYEMILSSTSDLISIVSFNLKATYEFVSPSHKELLGYESKDLIGKSFFDFVHPDDKKNISPVLTKYIKMKAKKLISGKEDKFAENLSYRIKDKKGQWHFLETTANIYGNKIIAVSKDVTEQRTARQELKESELQYRTIFNSSKDVLLVFDFDGNIVDANNAALKTYGYSKDEFLNLSGKDIVHPDFHYIFKKFILDVKDTGEFFSESVDVRKDGTTFPVNVKGTSFVLNGEEHLLAIVRDISKQKKAEENLKKSEEKYKSIFKNAQVGIFRTDLKTGKMLEANDALVKFTGFKNQKEMFEDNYNIADHYVNPSDRQKMIDILKSKGKIEGFVAPFKRLDGKVRWIRFSAQISKNKKWIEGVSEDITEWKESEKEIVKLSQAVDQSSSIIVTTDLKGNLEYVNDAFTKITGYSKEEVLGKNPSILKSSYTSKEEYKKLWKEISLGNTWQGTFHNKKKNGKLYWEFASISPVFNKNGEIMSYMKVAEDITKQKIAEEKIYSLSQIAEQSTDGIIKTDKDFKINYMNPAAEELFGYTFEELKGKKPDIFNAEIKSDEITNEIYDDISSGKIHFGESLNVRKDGTKFYCQYKVSPLKDDNGKITGYIASQRDITDIKESQKETERFLNAAADGIRIIGKDYKVKKLNQSMADLAGVKKDKAVGMNCREMFGDKNICGTDKCALKRVLKTGEKQILDTNRVTKDGRIIPCLDVVSPWYNKKGKIDGVIEDFRDLTHIKDISKKLRESENLFRTLVEQSTVGVYIHDPIDNKVLYANPLIRNILGFSDNEFEKADLYKYVHPDDLKFLKERTRKRLSGEEIDPSAEIRLIPPNKDMIWVRIYTNFIDYKGTKAALASAIEITESKKAREKIKSINEKLKQKVFERTSEVENLLKQKDEFIGQLGHDLKTPLTPLNTLLPIAQKKVKDESVKELINVSVQNVNYMKNLVSKTLELARLNSPSIEFDFTDLNLKDIVEGVLNKNKAIFRKENFSVQNNISKDIEVNADLMRLEEVFNNLIINAIKYSRNEISGKIIIDGEEKEKFIKISLKDYGVGLTPEQISKIFSEFYKTDTARSDFNSTGLGLPICKRIVEKHGGKIWVESPDLGKGSTFYFTLKKSKGGI